MRIGRTVPPAAAPIGWSEILHGLKGVVRRGAESERFTEELQTYFNRRYCSLFSSGKTALTVALLALKKLYPGKDRVLIPALTCYSVPSAIVRAGLQVTLCDIEPGTFDFDPAELRECLNDPRLLCVVPTHLFGSPADIPRLRRLLRDSSVPVIEDGAQALGATWNKERLGRAGDVSLFSLGRGKALSTVEGGILLTDNREIAAAIKHEMTFVKRHTGLELVKLMMVALAMKVLTPPALFWLPKSLPFLQIGATHFDPDFAMRTFSAFQAGLSRSWQERLETFRSQRRRNAEYWTELTAGGLVRPYLTAESLPDLIRFPIVCADESIRREILNKSERFGLGLAAVYPDTITGIVELQETFAGEQFPVAQQLIHRLATLPMHPLVTDYDRHHIVRIFGRGGADVMVAAVQQTGRAG